MKTLTLAIALIASAALAAEDELIKRGGPITNEAKRVALTSLLEKPSDYTKTPVVIEGVIVTSCDRKGCWMQIAPEAGKDGVRVTFKDYGFFIPLQAKGMMARAEGVASVKTLSKEEAEHLASEGASLKRNADGTAREVSFIATGVELTK